MGKQRKTYEKIMGGNSDNNIEFTDLCNMLDWLGCTCKRIRGDHFLYNYQDIQTIINLQPRGSKAKEYQVRQVREFLAKNGISRED